MDPQIALGLFGDAFFLIVLIVFVIIMPGLVVGLVVSTFQAATQINEQTLSFLPKLILTLLVVMWAGPWIVTKITDYFNYLFHNIPLLIG